MPPLTTNSGSHPPGADHAQPAPGILVVDDDCAVRRFLEHSLTRAGYRIFGASNLADAVTMFDLVRCHVRLALLDVSMPGGDGPEVLRELRLLSPELPAVFMSGELDPDMSDPLADRLRAEGASGLIAKPMRLPDLCAVLSATLAGYVTTACGLTPNRTGHRSPCPTPSSYRP
ncbi:MAG TPA: response regulator [Gemmataceae bacterium]|nr:response regulator [Gemmataceae bacterium]